MSSERTFEQAVERLYLDHHGWLKDGWRCRLGKPFKRYFQKVSNSWTPIFSGEP